MRTVSTIHKEKKNMVSYNNFVSKPCHVLHNNLDRRPLIPFNIESLELLYDVCVQRLPELFFNCSSDLKNVSQKANERSELSPLTYIQLETGLNLIFRVNN